MRWYSKKHGRVTDNREWVKVHLMCVNSTKVVTGVEVSGWTAHDTNYFVPLVERTAEHSDLERMSGDKAYLSKKNVQAVANAGAVPFVPFKSNSLPPSEDSAWSRMYHLFMFNREEFLRHYHGRSSAESVFSMVKAKSGTRYAPRATPGRSTKPCARFSATTFAS